MSVHEVVDPVLLHMNVLAPLPWQRKGSFETLMPVSRAAWFCSISCGKQCCVCSPMSDASWSTACCVPEGQAPLLVLIFGSVSLSL